MADPGPESVDVWQKLFEQTPAALRWVLGFLTLGLFTVLSIFYRWSRQDIQRIEQRIDGLYYYIDQKVDKEIENRVGSPSNQERTG